MASPEKGYSILDIAGLAGSLVGLLTCVGSILFYFYKKKSRVMVASSTKDDVMQVTLKNAGDFNIKVDFVRLLRKKSWFRGYEPSNNEFGYLVESEEFGFQSSQDDNLNLKLTVEDPIDKLIIPFERIETLYHSFLPYSYTNLHVVGELAGPIKMPDCYIGIYLNDGSLLKIKVDDSFYTYYRNKMNHEYRYEFSILKGNEKVKYTFRDESSYSQHKEKLLDSMSISERNYRYLKR